MRTTLALLCFFVASISRGDGFITASDGARIHYLRHVPAEASSDLVFVFVPGLMMPATVWNEQLNHFRAKHQVLAIDPRSQGDSVPTAEGHYPARKARDLRELLEQKDLRRVVLVAASSGVTDVAAYVDQFGTDRIAGFVLVHGVAGADYDSDTALTLVRWAQRFQTDRRTQTKALVRSLFVSTPPAEEEIRRLTEGAMKMPTSAAMATFLGSMAADYRSALPKIDKPTLIVVGESRWHDQYEAMSRSIKGSRLEKIKGVGHGLYIEAAGTFNRLLAEFVREIESEQH